MNQRSKGFPDFIKKFPKVELPPKVIGESYFIEAPQGQVVFHTLPEGQQVPLHGHDDSWAILVSGAMQVTVGADQFTAHPGRSWFIPKDVLHGGKALEDAMLVEVFCEKRFSAQRAG